MIIESEKLLEAKLRVGIKALGGWCLKIPAIHHAGIPDRICLVPVGRVFFAEIKTTKKKPTALQLLTHRKLRDMGFRVEVIDNTQRIKEILHDYTD